MRAALANEFDDRARAHHIEPAGRLVEDHDRGIVHQRTGDRDLLFHTGREGRRSGGPESRSPAARTKFRCAVAAALLLPFRTDGRSISNSSFSEPVSRPYSAVAVEKKADVGPDFWGSRRMSYPATRAVPLVVYDESWRAWRSVVVLPRAVGPEAGHTRGLARSGSSRHSRRGFSPRLGSRNSLPSLSRFDHCAGTSNPAIRREA